MAPLIRHEGTNHRGEPTSPRCDLIELRRLLDRAACGVRLLADRLKAAGEYPGPDAYQLEADLLLALRECRAVRVRRKRRTRIVAER